MIAPQAPTPKPTQTSPQPSGAPVRRTGDSTVVRAFSRRFYEALGGDGSGPVELSAEDVEEIDGEDEDDGDLVTATNIQPLRDRDGESTNPTPKTSLPRGRS